MERAKWHVRRRENREERKREASEMRAREERRQEPRQKGEENYESASIVQQYGRRKKLVQ